MSKTIAVYGSLKSGYYNNPMIMKGKMLGKEVIRGTMYSLGSYPALLEEGDAVHEVELWEIDEPTYDRVTDMEIGAGYKVKQVNFNGVLADVYFADDWLETHCKLRCKIISEY